MSAVREKINSPLGDWIRINRESRGWSLRYLAKQMGSICDASYISLIENNKSVSKTGRPIRPSEKIVDALADAFGALRAEVRNMVGYAPDNKSELFIPIDHEFAQLLVSSREWSEENRYEAYENAKMIFRRYQEKEDRMKLNSEEPGLSANELTGTDRSNPYLEKIEKDFEELRLRERRKEKPDDFPIKVESANEEDIAEFGYTVIDGKLIISADPAETKQVE